MPFTRRLLPYLVALPLLGVIPPSLGGVDPGLASAIDTLWNSAQPSARVLSATFIQRVSKDGTEYRTEVSEWPSYRESGGESAHVVIGSKRFDAVATPWGSFPRLDMSNDVRLLEINVPEKRYQVLSGKGAGLFGAGDWQRYDFLHVVEVGATPAYFPLYADAYLGVRVLGRLPDSPVLNYARLVPASRSNDGEIDAYEVSLYALGRKGPERVLRAGTPLAYLLRREDSSWIVSSVDRTPVTTVSDEGHRAFTQPLRPALLSSPENDAP